MPSIPQPNGWRQSAAAHSVGAPADVQQRLATVQHLLQAERLAEALAEIAPHRTTHFLLENAFGVCQLRQGNLCAALASFMNLAASDAVRRDDFSIVVQLNLAATLILQGDVGEGVDIMQDLQDASHPGLGRLWSAVRAWESQMSESQSKMWRFFQIPPRRPVKIVPFPGELL
jgi:hypothetical protein